MRYLVAIALLISVTPGVSEVVETAIHLVAHVDLPHHEADDEAEGCGEHTCTPLAHHCSCHTTMSAQVAARTATTHEFCSVTLLDPNAVAAVFGRVGEPPPLRPPIG